jgi:hypothetical protein
MPSKCHSVNCVHPSSPDLIIHVRFCLHPQGARSTHALEARIASLEHEASTLSTQLRHVTDELYTVNREVSVEPSSPSPRTWASRPSVETLGLPPPPHGQAFVTATTPQFHT